MKKRNIFLMVAFLMIAALLVACGGNNNNANHEEADNSNHGEVENENENEDNGDSNEGEASGLEGAITMAGSTSVQPLSEELAAAFMEIHSETRLEVAGGGSGAGVIAAQEGTADFGAVSREIAEDETG